MSRRAIYTRKSVAWSSVRSWSHKARQHDVDLLKRAKARVDDDVIGAAADELALHVRLMFGSLPGWMVSTVAVGHSRRPDSFAVRLAQAVAGRLDLSFGKLFADRFVDGVSHPKEFAKLQPLQPLAVPDVPVLLVDDVATSGWHLEEALMNLRYAGVTATAVAWISGTVR